MNPLLNQYDDSLIFVIEPAQECSLQPFNRSGSLNVRQGIVGLENVVENDEVAAPTGERATDGSSETAPFPGRHELGLRVLIPTQAGSGEYLPALSD